MIIGCILLIPIHLKNKQISNKAHNLLINNFSVLKKTMLKAKKTYVSTMPCLRKNIHLTKKVKIRRIEQTAIDLKKLIKPPKLLTAHKKDILLKK